MTALEQQCWRIASGVEGLQIAVERMRAPNAAAGPVLYVHGATFPSALAINWRFDDGVSWRDDLVRAGHDVWTFDFLGFGASDRFEAMRRPPDRGPLGRVDVAARQIAAVADHARRITGAQRVDLIAHSAGSLAAGRFAADRPDRVGRLVLFGPILRREGAGVDVAALPAWSTVDLVAQWTRFIEDVPPGHPGLIPPAAFERWGEAYLASDFAADTRSPAAVAIPAGPRADLAAAWAGDFPYDPGRIRAEVTVLRGEWDSLCPDADVAWLRSSLPGPLHDVKLASGTHLMLLETTRGSLWAAARQALGARTCEAAACE